MERKSLWENFAAFFPERGGAPTADPLGKCAQLPLVFFLLEQLIVQMEGQACAFPMFINHNNEPLLFFPPVHYIAIKCCRSATSLGKQLQRRFCRAERCIYILKAPNARGEAESEVREVGEPAAPPQPQRHTFSPLPPAGSAPAEGPILPPAARRFFVPRSFCRFVRGGTDPAPLLRGSRPPWHVPPRLPSQRKLGSPRKKAFQHLLIRGRFFFSSYKETSAHVFRKKTQDIFIYLFIFHASSVRKVH